MNATQSKPAPLTHIKLKFKNHGFVWVLIENGIVIGAFGSEPHRFVGLSEYHARRLAQYGKA